MPPPSKKTGNNCSFSPFNLAIGGSMDKKKRKPGGKTIISVRKVIPFQKLFGTRKTKKTAQQIKDEIKEERKKIPDREPDIQGNAEHGIREIIK